MCFCQVCNTPIIQQSPLFVGKTVISRLQINLGNLVFIQNLKGKYCMQTYSICLYFPGRIIHICILLGFDCYVRERSGYRHYSTSSRDALIVSSPQQCSNECRRRSSYCRSFSYRYYFGTGSSESFSGENCLLSDLEAQSLNSQTDLIVDSTWDLYRQKCRDNGGLFPDTGAGGRRKKIELNCCSLIGFCVF